MSKERITAYLKEKAKTQDIDKREFDRLTELINGYLKYDDVCNNRYCSRCKFKDFPSTHEPCINCIDNPLKPNFELK